MVKLGDVANFVRGLTFKPSSVIPTEKGLIVLRTKNIQEKLDLTDLIAIPQDLLKREDQLVQSLDTLVSVANSWNLVGKCCIAPLNPTNLAIGGFIAALRSLNADKLDPQYLYHWFNSTAIQNTVRSFSNKTTNISNLQIKRCLDLMIPLPSLGEQKRIAKILGKVAESTRKIEYELELLGGLPLFDWSWTGETQNLADVVIVRSGTVDPTLPENRKLPLIAPDSIERDTGNILELKTCEEAGVTSGKYHFHRGDVLYSKIRPYLNKVAIAPCDGLCSADMYALDTKGNFTPETLQAILMSRQFLAYASQTSGRASIPKVNRKNLLAYEVPKLSNAQIFEITKKIQTVNKVRALLHQKLALLKELQYSLSARAFAGQL